MDDAAFGAAVQRLFDEAPSAADSPLFAWDVERRIARAWALRRLLIVAAGAGGGALALTQSLASGVGERLLGAPRLLAAARQGLHEVPIVSRLSALDLPFGGEVVWLVVGLIVLAIALLVGRRMDGI